MEIVRATEKDIDDISDLYGAVCDHLAAGTNYSGWSRDRYPTRDTAISWTEQSALFLLRDKGHVAGSIALTHKWEPGYEKADWQIPSDYDRIFVVHTVAVHPDYLGRGVASAMMRFAEVEAHRRGMVALRLDVCDFNKPAVALYEKCGYRCAGCYDLFGKPAPYDLYRLYELVLQRR